MPAIDRERSTDRGRMLTHQHSISDLGKVHIPMWDSADPDRAPPPLPQNPGSPGVSTTRPNTSANIAAAARLLQDRARESASTSPYTTNPMPQRSPERSLIKGAAHKRMQSLQPMTAPSSPTAIRDFRNVWEETRSADKSPERNFNFAGLATPSYNNGSASRANSPEKSPIRSRSPTPIGRELVREGSFTSRQSGRGMYRGIVGQSTSPSFAIAPASQPATKWDHDPQSTMNTTEPSAVTKAAPPFDAISSQILSLTNIATNLQREMAQLSRRSKDNATDLVSLKEATNTRDEDIRKTLRELLSSVNSGNHVGLLTAPTSYGSRSAVTTSSNVSKDHPPSPSLSKTFTLPRIPSPSSFLLDERMNSPSPYSIEGAASVAMLEKIIREMVTKEGQERLLSTLSQLMDKHNQDSVDSSKITTQRLEELMDFIKLHERKLASHAGKAVSDTLSSLDRASDFTSQTSSVLTASDTSGTSSTIGVSDGKKAFSSPKAADFVSAEMLKLLKKIKESITESGGMTAEVKALVRDLRSEVLGMGREIARKLDEPESVKNSDSYSRADTEEVLDTVRLGLDDLRSHLDRKIDNPERQMSATSEIIDALTDGLETIRADVSRSGASEVASYFSEDVWETLKEGINEIRADIRHLKTAEVKITENSHTDNKVVLAKTETVDGEQLTGVGSLETMLHEDIERMQVMLTQLHMKIEALSTPSTSSESNVAEKAINVEVAERLDSMHDLLHDLKETRADERGSACASDSVAKEDIDALETLLHNIKSRLEETHTGNLEQVQRMHDDVRSNTHTLEDLSARVEEEIATKEDVALIERLLQEMRPAFEASTAKREMPAEEEIVTKADLDALGILCTEIKNHVAESSSSEADEHLTKAELEQLSLSVKEMHESHEKFKESYETDIAVTAKAFDDRKKEAADVVERVREMKHFLEDLKEDMLLHVRDIGSKDDHMELHGSIKALEETVAGREHVELAVDKLVESIGLGFGQAQGAIDGLRMEQDEKTAVMLEKHDEASAAVIAEVSQKIEDQFDVLIVKYEDAQTLATTQAAAVEEKAAQQEELMAASKVMAEELKVTIDTLGSSVLGLGSSLNDATARISDDSRTVFSRVGEAITSLEEAGSKLDITQAKIDTSTAENTTAQHLMRDEVTKANDKLLALQITLADFHPHHAETLQQILMKLNQQHEDHEDSQRQIREDARVAAAESKAINEDIKNSFSAIPALLPAPSSIISERSDDNQLHEKLDKLLTQAEIWERALPQLEKVEEIHSQVSRAINEMPKDMPAPTIMRDENHDGRQKEAEELLLAIERRGTQKQQLEVEIIATNEEIQTAKESLGAVREEVTSLQDQRAHLMAETAALQAALSVRREELASMEVKAHSLERRILDGIMDHSRALLIAREAQVPKTRAQGQQRNTSGASHSTVGALPQSRARVAAKGINMALSSGTSAYGRDGNARKPTAAMSSRRIHSLSQITHNVPTGASALAGVGGHEKAAASTANIPTRSHSVKTQWGRKASWGGRRSYSTSLANKENEAVTEEDCEGREQLSVISADDDEDLDGEDFGASDADAGKCGIHTPTDDGEGEGKGDGNGNGNGNGNRDEDEDDAESSYVTGSELAYGSSYLSEADGETSRRSSAASTVRSRAGAKDMPSKVDGGDLATGPGMRLKDGLIVNFNAPSDSGFGSELPAAAVGGAAGAGADGDYFRRAAEELTG